MPKRHRRDEPDTPENTDIIKLPGDEPEIPHGDPPGKGSEKLPGDPDDADKDPTKAV